MYRMATRIMYVRSRFRPTNRANEANEQTEEREKKLIGQWTVGWGGSSDGGGGGDGGRNMHAAFILASFQNKSTASFSFRASNGPMILHFFIERERTYFSMDFHLGVFFVCSFVLRTYVRLHISMLAAAPIQYSLFMLPCLPLRKVTYCWEKYLLRWIMYASAS